MPLGYKGSRQSVLEVLVASLVSLIYLLVSKQIDDALNYINRLEALSIIYKDLIAVAKIYIGDTILMTWYLLYVLLSLSLIA